MSKYTKFIKVKPRKWWSLKAWKKAKVLEEFDNWFLTRPKSIEAVVNYWAKKLHYGTY